MSLVRVMSRCENSYQFNMNDGVVVVINGRHKARIISDEPIGTLIDAKYWNELKDRYATNSKFKRGLIFAGKNENETLAMSADKDVDTETGTKPLTRKGLNELTKIHKVPGQLETFSEAE